MIEIHEKQLIDEYMPNCIFTIPYNTDDDLCLMEQFYAQMMRWTE